MQQHHRSSVVISALLTTLVMTLVAGGLLAYNGMLPLPGVSAQENLSQTSQQEAPIVVTVQPVLAPVMEQAAAPASLPNFAPAAAARTDTGAAVASQNAGDPAVIAAYQAQLEEAYKALQEAYNQIDVLQNAQPQMAVATFHDDDDEHEEHGEGSEHEGGEREDHDD